MMAAHDSSLSHAGAIRGFCASRMGIGMVLASVMAAVDICRLLGSLLGDVTDDRLAFLADRHVLHGDSLLALLRLSFSTWT
jgi:hypothetical protein